MLLETWEIILHMDIMDIEVIYNTAKEDIPILKEFIDKHIKRLFSEKTE